jgi:hypothetical protein
MVPGIYLTKLSDVTEVKLSPLERKIQEVFSYISKVERAFCFLLCMYQSDDLFPARHLLAFHSEIYEQHLFSLNYTALLAVIEHALDP